MLIVQITDTHLVPEGQHWFGDSKTQTDKRLNRVIAYINQMNPLPDLVVLTGDATDEGSLESYAHLKKQLSCLKTPIYLIPGNHDHRENMKRVFNHQRGMQANFINYTVELDPVRLIFLDTHVPGQSYGTLCKDRLEWLEKTLAKSHDHPSLIFMHHPPAKTGTKIFDEILCKTSSAFEELVRNQKNLLGLFTGHYHHFCLTTFGNKTCFMAPSVAPVHYFAHPLDDHVTALELSDPAITIHRWEKESGIRSQIVFVKDQLTRIDWKQLKKH